MRLGEGPAGFQIASCQAAGAVEEPIVNGPVTAPASRRAITSRRWCAKHWLRSCGRRWRKAGPVPTRWRSLSVPRVWLGAYVAKASRWCSIGRLADECDGCRAEAGPPGGDAKPSDPFRPLPIAPTEAMARRKYDGSAQIQRALRLSSSVRRETEAMFLRSQFLPAAHATPCGLRVPPSLRSFDSAQSKTRRTA